MKKLVNLLSLKVEQDQNNASTKQSLPHVFPIQLVKHRSQLFLVITDSQPDFILAFHQSFSKLLETKFRDFKWYVPSSLSSKDKLRREIHGWDGSGIIFNWLWDQIKNRYPNIFCLYSDLATNVLEAATKEAAFPNIYSIRWRKSAVLILQN